MMLSFRDSKRVRLTHKQLDKRADPDFTDDTVAKRAQLFDSPSSRSSSHEIAPNSHGDPETREKVAKDARVDADMEVSSIEALTKAKLGSIEQSTLQTKIYIACWRKFR